jgi:hypothetical protein
MLAAYLCDPVTPHALREQMAAAEVPSLLLPQSLDATVVADLRARVEAAGLTRYELADRGKYDHNDTLQVAELWNELGQFAADLTGAPMSIARVRWFRLRRGDYSLVKDDSRTRAPGDRHLELVLDLSAGNTGEADVVYADGRNALAVPQISGLLAVVARSPSVARYMRPPTIRSFGGHDVVRLILQFQPVT